MEDIKVGVLGIDVVANVPQFEQQADRELKAAAERVGDRAGRQMGRRLAEGVASGGRISPDKLIESDVERLKEAAKRVGYTAGRLTADSILQAAEQRFKQATGDAKEAFVRGLIDKKEFERQGRQAAQDFNTAVLKGLKELGGEGGVVSQQEASKLTNALKTAGAEGEKGFREKLKGLPRFVRGAFLTGMLAAFTLVANKIVQVFRSVATRIRATLERGGEVQEAIQSSYQLLTSHGLSPSRALEEMRKGTRGLVSDLELLRRASLAVQAGLPVNERMLGRLAVASRRLGQVVGLETAPAWEKLIHGLATGEADTLKQLGLITTMESALRDWRKETGRDIQTLTQQQRMTILFNAVLEELKQKLEGLGPDALSMRQHLQQLTTWWINVKDAAARAIVESPRIAKFFKDIGDKASESARAIENFADHVGALVDLLVSVGARVGSLANKFPFNLVIKGNVAITKGLGELAGGQSFDDFLKARQLKREIARLQEEADLLQGKGGDTTGDTSGFGADQEALARAKRNAEERKRILEQLTDRVYALTHTAEQEGIRALEKLEEEYVQAGGKITDAVRKQFEALKQDLQLSGTIGDLKRELSHVAEMKPSPEALSQQKELVRRILEQRDAVETTSDRWRELNDLYRQARQQLEAMAPAAEISQIRAEFEQRKIELREALARGLIDEKAFKREGEKAAEIFNQAVLKKIKRLREEGKNELADLLVPQLIQTPDQKQAREEELRDLRDRARLLEENARAGIQVAESIGLIGSESAKALENVAQLGAAIARIAGGDLSAIPSAIGAIASLVSSALGGQSAEERRQQVRAMADLTQALKDLRDAVLSDITSAERTDLVSVLQRLDENIDKPGKFELGPAGLRYIREAEKQTGITILGPNGEVDRDALRAAIKKLIETPIGAFATDLEGRLDALDYRMSFLADSTAEATQRLDGLIDIMKKFSPNFEKEFERIFQEQGADAALAFVQATAARLAANDQTLFQTGGLFEGLTAEEAKRLLQEIRDALQASVDTAGADTGTTQGFQVFRGITELQGNLFLQYQQSMLIVLQDVAASNRGILSGLGGNLPAGLPTMEAAAIPAPPTASTAVSATTVISFGDINVSISTGADLTPEQARAAGMMAGQAILRQIDQGLGLRNIDYRRFRGIIT